jgi:IS30 family transposase
VLGLIREDWSPKQISGYLKKQENIAISHETIYKWIRRDKLNGGELYKHCRHKLKHHKRPVGSAKNIPNRTSRERPREADGSRFGDFEMDMIIGPNHSEAILTITERKTNYLMIKKLPILIVHGKKERLKTGINLSGNTSRKRHHLKIIRMRISKKSGTNQTEDLEKN